MSRIQGDLEFSKNWENDEDFPTREYNETVVRENIQLLFDETKDYINDVVTPAVNDNMERIENMGGGGSVSHDQIGDGAVWENNIKNYAVTEYKYGQNSIPPNAFKDGSITSEKFNTASVNEYVEGRITAYGTATQTKNGLMSASDKAVFDGVKGIRYFVGSYPLSAIGYIPIATITIRAGYSDMPILVTVMSRNFGRPVTAIIKFVNSDSTDPDLESLTHHGGDLTFGMHRDEAGTWTLYVRKTGAYDEIHVVDFFLGGYMAGNVTWSWRSGSELVSSLPSGTITSTRYIEPDSYALLSYPSSRPTTANYNYHDARLRYFLATNTMTEGAPPVEGNVLHLAWDNNGWDSQIAVGSPSSLPKHPRMFIRSADGTGAFGEWVRVYTSTNPPDNATTSANGLMSAADKTKLNGIATGAEVNQNAFSNVTVGSTTISADGKTDTLTLVAGSNVTLTPDATNDKVTIASTNTTYSAATQSAAGLMSAADKKKLDGVATGANAYSLPTASSSTLGGVKTGSNITNSSGTISVSSSNVANALGYTPMANLKRQNGVGYVNGIAGGLEIGVDFNFDSGHKKDQAWMYFDCATSSSQNRSAEIEAHGDLYPDLGSTWSLGYSGHKWDNVWSDTYNGGSDKRLKQDINYDMSKYLELFDSLKPCSFRWKNKPQEEHTGIIAQDVLSSLENNGVQDSALIVTDTDDGMYGARYMEFIGILIAKVQDLQRQVDELKAGGN